MKKENGWRLPTIDELTLVEQMIKDLNIKLTEANRDKKSVKAALVGAERQAKD